MNLELKTERLILRPLAETDVDLEVEIGTDPEVMKYVGELETNDQVVQQMPNFSLERTLPG